MSYTSKNCMSATIVEPMGKNTNNRPGFMLYLDCRQSFELLSEVQRGKLILDIFYYVELGVVPEYSDDTNLAIIWSTLMPKLDYDEARYRKKVSMSKYAVFCREERKQNHEPISYDEWCDSKQIDCLNASPDIDRYPTTAPNTPSITVPTTETTRTASSFSHTASVGKGKLEGENRLASDTACSVYEPLSEAEFNRKREAGLAMLDARRSGRNLQP